MKKLMLLLATAGCMTVLWGCMGSVQIEDRNYVMAMGIDYDEDEKIYDVSLSFPDLKALTGDGDNIHYPVMKIRGSSLKDVEDIYHQESSKRLDFGHLQTIIFGKELLENRPALEVMISYMKMHQSFTRTTDVCAAAAKAADIVALDESVNGSIGFYIRDMFENNGKVNHYEAAVLNDLIVAQVNADDAVTMAVLEAKEDIPVVTGTVVFSSGNKALTD